MAALEDGWLRPVRGRIRIPPSDLRAALLLVWLAASIALGAAAAAALILPERTVLAAAAQCSAHGSAGEKCALCGMTHAFLAMRRGDLREAKRANAASVLLFPALAANEALMVFVLASRMRRGWRKRIRRAAPGGPAGA